MNIFLVLGDSLMEGGGGGGISPSQPVEIVESTKLLTRDSFVWKQMKSFSLTYQ